MNEYQRFVIFLDKIDGIEATSEDIKAHVKFLENLEKENILEMGGPFSDFAGGMLIIKANNFEEAKKIATSDPFVELKIRKLELRTWELSCKENNHLGRGSR